MSSNKGETKPVINFEYPCYICGYIFSKPSVVVDHVKRIHGYELPKHPRGRRRPKDHDYEIQNNASGSFDIQHYSCASCWFHCPQSGVHELAYHVVNKHHPINVDPTKNDNGKEPVIYPKEAIQQIKEQEEEEEEEEYETDEEGEIEQEFEEDNQEEESEEETKQESQPSFPYADATDIINKLNELTNLFKNLIK